VSFIVAVDARAQGAFEVGDGGAVDEVVQVLLRCAWWLQDSLDGRFAETGQRRVQTRERGVDVVEKLLSASVGSSRLHRRLYLELDRDLGLDYIYATARSFERIYLLLYNVAYRSVLRGKDCILLE
jgi:hypothetical protein